MSTARCPHCGAIVPPRAQWCPSCAEVLNISVGAALCDPRAAPRAEGRSQVGSPAATPPTRYARSRRVQPGQPGAACPRCGDLCDWDDERCECGTHLTRNLRRRA